MQRILERSSEAVKGVDSVIRQLRQLLSTSDFSFCIREPDPQLSKWKGRGGGEAAAGGRREGRSQEERKAG